MNIVEWQRNATEGWQINQARYQIERLGIRPLNQEYGATSISQVVSSDLVAPLAEFCGSWGQNEQQRNDSFFLLGLQFLRHFLTFSDTRAGIDGLNRGNHHRKGAHLEFPSESACNSGEPE